MFIIGVSGGTGSGKTTLVHALAEKAKSSNLTIISQDSYYKETGHLSFEERTHINFDHPDSIEFSLLAEHLQQLKSGHTIKQPEYSFIEHNRTSKTRTVEPCGVLIVEGILVLSQPEVRKHCDFMIYVDADSDERLIRRIERDTTERGRDLKEVLSWYRNTLKPMHLKFIEPSKEYADLIIPNNVYGLKGIEAVHALVKQYV